VMMDRWVHADVPSDPSSCASAPASCRDAAVGGKVSG
jgi:hypothetical protein